MPQSSRRQVTNLSPRFFEARSAAKELTACSKVRPSYLPELTHTPYLDSYHSCQEASVKMLFDADTASTIRSSFASGAALRIADSTAANASFEACVKFKCLIGNAN